MHEMGIANSVLDTVRTEAGRHPGMRPVKVGLRIGEMAAIDRDALRFCFEALAKGTELDGLQLEIELCPRRHRCRACGSEFEVRDCDFRCPVCQEMSSECVCGDELELAYMELDDDEPSPVGAKSSK